MAQSLSESVVGAVASALDFPSDKTHRMSGAKAGADIWERSAPSQSHSRSRWRTAENPPVKVRAAMMEFWRPLRSVDTTIA